MSKTLTFHIMTETEKQTVCSWKYESIYAVYNLPPYQQMKDAKKGFFDPAKEKNYYAFYDNALLVGYVNIREMEKEVFVGIGVRPENCGQGYGKQILNTVSGIAQNLYPGKPLFLEVRTWNSRAIRCYAGAGFEIEGDPVHRTTDIGPGAFYRMVKANLPL